MLSPITNCISSSISFASSCAAFQQRSPTVGRYSADGFCRQVDGYDGQIITVEGRDEYELGNYLGGGVAGVVYEAMRLRPPSGRYDSSPVARTLVPPADEKLVAMKILNPLNFRLLPPSSLADPANPPIILQRGHPLRPGELTREEHIWWIIHPNSRNLRNLKNRSTSSAKLIDRGSPNRGIKLSVIACFWDTKMEQLRELPLRKCIEVWGMVPFGCSEEEFEQRLDEIEKLYSVTAGSSKSSVDGGRMNDLPKRLQRELDLEDSGGQQRQRHTQSSDNSSNLVLASLALANTKKVAFCEPLNAHISLPVVPPKYLRWLRQRRAATKEIRNMMRIGRHKNVVHLHEVLELIQDTKVCCYQLKAKSPH